MRRFQLSPRGIAPNGWVDRAAVCLGRGKLTGDGLGARPGDERLPGLAQAFREGSRRRYALVQELGVSADGHEADPFSSPPPGRLLGGGEYPERDRVPLTRGTHVGDPGATEVVLLKARQRAGFPGFAEYTTSR